MKPDPADRPASAPTSASARCPVCGEFVGAFPRCAQCGAAIETRQSLRIYRVAAILLATVGLALLFAMARYREIPVVRVGEIERSMNFAFVRVRGEAADDARIFRKDGRIESLRFTVRDETGEIVVRAHRDRAQWLVEHDRVPGAGDSVEATGSLNVTSDGVALWVQAPEKLTVTRRVLPRKRLADIVREDAGQSFRITGEIVSVRAPQPGTRAPWIAEVRDGSGSGRLVFFQSVRDEIPDPSLLERGVRFEARVTVSLYRDELQLTLSRGGDLRPASPAPTEAPASEAETAAAPPPAAPAEPEEPVRLIRDLGPADVGSTVRVRGRVESLHPPRPGTRIPWQLQVREEDAAVKVVYWEAVAGQLAAVRTPQVGDAVEVTAPLEEYRGQLQLRVGRAEQIRLLSAASAGESPAP